MSERLQNDVDPIETRDWLQAIESVIREEGVERAQYPSRRLCGLQKAADQSDTERAQHLLHG